MRGRGWAPWAVAASFLLGAAAAGEERAPKIFDANTQLQIDLEADWGSVARDRKNPPSPHEAKLTYQGPDGPVTLQIGVQTRGRSRLRKEVCEFPPLRLEFPKESRKGTLFRGIQEMKLATHCQRSGSYEQNLLLEYLLYRTYGLLTEQSHRVRLLQVRYFEPGGKKPRWERAGFVIEDGGDLAERLGVERVRETRLDGASLDPVAGARVEIFYYLIGMTDFSMIAAQEAGCCHNSRAFRRADGSYFTVPYDFDQTGVVDPEYAFPAPGLGIRSVTQRRFRGLCRPPEAHEAAIAQLREKRAEITALFESLPQLSASRRSKALRFLDGFFDWASDPAKVRETLAKECRSTSV
jgi:hypothetical protein